MREHSPPHQPNPMRDFEVAWNDETPLKVRTRILHNSNKTVSFVLIVTCPDAKTATDISTTFYNSLNHEPEPRAS